MTISAQSQGVGLEVVPMPLTHSLSSCLSIPQNVALVSRVWKKGLEHPKKIKMPLLRPRLPICLGQNPEPSHHSPFTHPLSLVWLILSLPGILEPFPLWLVFLPPVFCQGPPRWP